MLILLTINFFIFLIVSCIGMFFGLNPRKWTSWLYGFYGFLTGFLFYFIRPNFIGSLQLGLMIAFAFMYTGIMVFRHRERYKG